jgi:hypothetical protein
MSPSSGFFHAQARRYPRQCAISRQQACCVCWRCIRTKASDQTADTFRPKESFIHNITAGAKRLQVVACKSKQLVSIELLAQALLKKIAIEFEYFLNFNQVGRWANSPICLAL